MTIREILTNIGGVVVLDTDLATVLAIRGLTGDETIAELKESNDLCKFYLAKADLLWDYSYRPSGGSQSVKMGNFSQTVSNSSSTTADRQAMRDEANRLYEQCGEETKTSGTVIRDLSDKWARSKRRCLC